MNNTIPAKDTDTDTQRPSTHLIAFFFGASVSALVTAAIVSVLTSYTKLPLYLAFAILAVACASAVLAMIYWATKGILSRRLFGVGVKDLATLADDIATDVTSGRYKTDGILGRRIREAISYWTAYKIRMAFVGFIFLLLGEIFLLVNIAKIVEQTGILRSQNTLLSDQNYLIGNAGRYENQWSLYKDILIENRVVAFNRLLAMGESSFPGANLGAATFDNLTLDRGLDLTGISFKETTLRNSTLSAVILTGADFSEAVLENVNLDSARLNRATFENGTMENCTLRAASLVHASLDALSVVSTDFEGADFSFASIRGVNPGTLSTYTDDLRRRRDTSFSSAKFRGANLSNSDLRLYKFVKADFSDATLINTRLDGADLQDAILAGAVLFRADFNHANLKGVDFTNSEWDKTNLRWANIHEAKGLTVRQLLQAYYGPNSNPVLPYGLNVILDGMKTNEVLASVLFHLRGGARTAPMVILTSLGLNAGTEPVIVALRKIIESDQEGTFDRTFAINVAAAIGPKAKSLIPMLRALRADSNMTNITQAIDAALRKIEQ